MSGSKEHNHTDPFLWVQSHHPIPKELLNDNPNHTQVLLKDNQLVVPIGVKKSSTQS